MAKQEAEEAGEDYERSQFWNYSAESVERWNEKQEAKRIRMDNKFTGKKRIVIGTHFRLLPILLEISTSNSFSKGGHRLLWALNVTFSTMGRSTSY